MKDIMIEHGVFMPNYEEESTETILQNLGKSSNPKSEPLGRAYPTEGVPPTPSVMDKKDSFVIKIIEKNPTHKKRLEQLFDTLQSDHLKEMKVDHFCMETLVTNASSVVNLFAFFKSYSIDSRPITLKAFLNVSPYKEVFRHGVRILANKGLIEPLTLQLMLAFPEQATSIANLIVNFHDRSFSIPALSKILLQLPRNKIGAAVNLLSLLLDKGVFYTKHMDILIKQEKHLDIIYEGAKLLTENQSLLSDFMEIVQKNPHQAKVMAKIILLLQNTPSLSTTIIKNALNCGQFGLGTYYCLLHFKRANLLDEKHYKMIFQHYSALEKEEVIDAFSQLPLFGTLEKDTLLQLLALLDTNSDSSAVVEVIQGTRLPSPFTP